MTNKSEAPANMGRLVIGLAFALGLVNYLDRVVISYAIGPIQKDFGIDNASFGLAMSAFAAGTLLVNGFLDNEVVEMPSRKALWGLFFGDSLCF